ncbi:WD40 repeat domain-containing protein [Streptomyces sp. NPDC127044]
MGAYAFTGCHRNSPLNRALSALCAAPNPPGPGRSQWPLNMTRRFATNPTFDDDGLHVRDLATGRSIRDAVLQFDGEARALACAVVHNRPVAVVATNPKFPGDGRVYVWDVATGRQIGEVRTLACSVLDGRPVAVVALGFGLDSFSQLYVYDLTTGRSIGQRRTGYAGTGQALACTDIDGRPVTVVATGTPFGDGGVHVRDLATGHPIGNIVRFDGAARALACTVLDGRPVALVAATSADHGGNGRVHLLEVASGRAIGEPFTGFHGEARAWACSVLDGRPVALGSDLHVWDIRTRQPLQHFVVPSLRNVEFSPDGSLVVLMGRDVAVFLRRSDKQAL